MRKRNVIAACLLLLLSSMAVAQSTVGGMLATTGPTPAVADARTAERHAEEVVAENSFQVLTVRAYMCVTDRWGYAQLFNRLGATSLAIKIMSTCYSRKS